MREKMSQMNFLVVIETQRVKGYLFASPILRETRGASLLLDNLNRDETKELLQQPKFPKRTAGGNKASYAGIDDSPTWELRQNRLASKKMDIRLFCTDSTGIAYEDRQLFKIHSGNTAPI
jgi:hypothetical protein